jgi:hypothetical protein
MLHCYSVPQAPEKAHHLDVGADLRVILSRNVSSLIQTTSGLSFIKGVLEQGLLLEDQHFTLTRKIISSFLDRYCFSSNNLRISNGILRHAGQARDIASVAAIRTLIVLECSVDSVFCRLRDNVVGDRTERFDDDVALVDKNLCLFLLKKYTAPLVDYYYECRSGKRSGYNRQHDNGRRTLPADINACPRLSTSRLYR